MFLVQLNVCRKLGVKNKKKKMENIKFMEKV